MNDMPRGFEAAQRAYENASPPDDDELDHYIEQVEADDDAMAECRESAFDTEAPIELAALLVESKQLIVGLANGRKVLELDGAERDQFAKLAREVDRLAANLADKVQAEAQRLLDRAIDDAEEARADAMQAAREDREEWR